jgi:calmodulin
LKEIISKLNPADKGLIDFQVFCDLVSKEMKAPIGEQEIIEAFQVFDRDGNGMISAAELRHIMTSIGEKLTDEEVDEMLREAEVDGTLTKTYRRF